MGRECIFECWRLSSVGQHFTLSDTPNMVPSPSLRLQCSIDAEKQQRNGYSHHCFKGTGQYLFIRTVFLHQLVPFCDPWRVLSACMDAPRMRRRLCPVRWATSRQVSSLLQSWYIHKNSLWLWHMDPWPVRYTFSLLYFLLIINLV